MRLLHAAGAVTAAFDDPNLVSRAGLEPVMRLAEDAGLHGLVTEKVHVPTDKGSNAAGKVATIVAGMVAGADSIDKMNMVRDAGTRTLFGGVYAPSTLGSFLRAFSHGHVQQLHSAARGFLTRLVARTRGKLLAGAEQVCFVDIDSMLRRVYGKAKQGVGFGHAKVGGYNVLLRGYHPLLATLSTLVAAPVLAAVRLRGGKAGSARGAASMVAEAIATARSCGATGLIIVRADSAFHAKKVIWACRRAAARFSVTVKMDNKIRQVIAAIPDDAWVHIRYPQAIWDEDEQRWISDAQIAEISYTAFEGTRWAITARLIVRRVRRLNPKHKTGHRRSATAGRRHPRRRTDPAVRVRLHHRGVRQDAAGVDHAVRRPGAFFNRHEFSYYDDIRNAQGQYQAFAEVPWTSPGDGLSKDILNLTPDQAGDASALNANTASAVGGTSTWASARRRASRARWVSRSASATTATRACWR